MVATKNKFETESPFELTRAIELQYATALRKLAVKIGSAISRFPDLLNNPGQRAQYTKLMSDFSETITPWAQAASSRVLRAVDIENRKAWNAHSRRMSERLRYEIQHAPTGTTLARLQAEQVGLIKSMPIDAAERVHKIALQNLTNGGMRAAEFAEMIANTTGVTKSRATLIARTETSRVSSNLTQARAEFVGSVAYRWRTSKDSDVRPSHAAMEDHEVMWASPPTLDNLTGHAGCLPNCRCHPAPILGNY